MKTFAQKALVFTNHIFYELFGPLRSKLKRFGMENGDHLIPEQLDPGPPSPCKPGLYPNHDSVS